MNDILNSLSIEKNNFGSCSGPDGWIKKTDTKIIESYNPSNGEKIATVYEATVDEYNIIIKKSIDAFHEWRKVPAPVRGDLVREMGNALRDYKDQ